MQFPMFHPRRLFVSALFAVAWPSAVQCQSATTGGLAGAVTDPAGVALPQVTVTLANSATMAAQSAVTSASGAYTFSLLAPGASRQRCGLARFRKTMPPAARQRSFWAWRSITAE